MGGSTRGISWSCCSRTRRSSTRSPSTTPGRSADSVDLRLARDGRTFDGFGYAVDYLLTNSARWRLATGASVADLQLLGASPGEQTAKLVVPVPVPALDLPDEALAELDGTTEADGGQLVGRSNVWVDEQDGRSCAVNINVGPAIDGWDRERLA